MKNFKLLLATTAILSTGALIANATVVGQDTLDIPVSAEVIRPLSLGYTQALDFGRVVIPEGNYILNMNMDNSGNISFSGPGNRAGVYMLGNAKPAIITGVNCAQLQLPAAGNGNYIQLTNPEGAPTGNKAEITSLYCSTVDNTTIIRGSLAYTAAQDNEDNYLSIYPGVYTGEITITAIYPDDPRESDGE